MSLEDFREALACKVAGTWNIHHAAAETQGNKLDFFTMLSSISGIVGTASQANYAAGNSFQDAFALHRHSLGLAAHSINLGIVEDVGYMSEHQSLTDRVSSRSGLSSINERQLHEILKLSILQQTSKPSTATAGQMITGLPFPLPMESPLASDMRFHSLLIPQHAQATVSGRANGDGDGTQAFRAMLRSSLPADKLVDEACKMVNRQLVQALGLVADVEESKPLSSYGIDSLAAVDLRNWFKLRVGVEMTTLDILNASNLRSMSKKVVEQALEAYKLQVKA